MILFSAFFELIFAAEFRPSPTVVGEKGSHRCPVCLCEASEYVDYEQLGRHLEKELWVEFINYSQESLNTRIIGGEYSELEKFLELNSNPAESTRPRGSIEEGLTVEIVEEICQTMYDSESNFTEEKLTNSIIPPVLHPFLPKLKKLAREAHLESLQKTPTELIWHVPDVGAPHVILCGNCGLEQPKEWREEEFFIHECYYCRQAVDGIAASSSSSECGKMWRYEVPGDGGSVFLPLFLSPVYKSVVVEYSNGESTRIPPHIFPREGRVLPVLGGTSPE